MNLDELRTALTDLDAQLVKLVARRQALSEQVAAAKRATGRPTRDFGREREVILRGRTAAAGLGVSRTWSNHYCGSSSNPRSPPRSRRGLPPKRTAAAKLHW